MDDTRTGRYQADYAGQEPARSELDAMEGFAVPFAVRCQCAFLGWPEALAGPLRAWTRRSHEASQTRDRAALSELAAEFRAYVEEQLSTRRASSTALSPVSWMATGTPQARSPSIRTRATPRSPPS